MNILPIPTRRVTPPQDNLEDVYRLLLPHLVPGSVVAISSKIVAIEEGQCLAIEGAPPKDELIMSHADYVLGREHVPGNWVMHTLTDGILIPSAGIDESNANGHYIFWPQNSKASAKRIGQFLRQQSGIEDLGVVITDSHSVPLRRGVVGIALSHWGFEPLADYRGKTDIFGRELKISQANLPDGLAAAAVLAMGEGDEQTPIVVMTELPSTLVFCAESALPLKEFASYEVPLREDLYYPFLGANIPWEKGGREAR